MELKALVTTERRVSSLPTRIERESSSKEMWILRLWVSEGCLIALSDLTRRWESEKSCSAADWRSTDGRFREL